MSVFIKSFVLILGVCAFITSSWASEWKGIPPQPSGLPDDGGKMPPVLKASYKGKVDELREILTADPKLVNYQTKNFQTAACYACSQKNREKNVSVHLLEVLAEFHADFNIPNNDMMAPVHIACCDSNLPALQFLLARQVRLDTTDLSNDRTPLGFSVSADFVDGVTAILAANPSAITIRMAFSHSLWNIPFSDSGNIQQNLFNKIIEINAQGSIPGYLAGTLKEQISERIEQVEKEIHLAAYWTEGRKEQQIAFLQGLLTRL